MYTYFQEKVDIDQSTEVFRKILGQKCNDIVLCRENTVILDDEKRIKGYTRWFPQRLSFIANFWVLHLLDH